MIFGNIKYPPLIKDKRTKKGIEEVSFFFSYREEDIPIATLEIIFKWDYQTGKFKDFYKYKQAYGKRNAPLGTILIEKIEKDFEKYYREVLTKQLIPID